MKTLVALALVGIGVWLFHDGWTMRDTFKGKTQRTLASVARSIDGETRVPEHSWYMIAGGVAVLAGAGVLFAGRKR